MPRAFSKPASSLLFGALVVAVSISGAAGAARPRRVLPDLVALPTEQLAGPSTTLELDGGTDPVRVDGCYVEERVRKNVSRCLRFDGIVGNVGDGAFELAYTFRKDKGLVAVQRVFNEDGTYADRYAIQTEFHPTHAHFHVSDFYLARLWRTDATGARLGDAPVASGDKNGFCPQDSSRIETYDRTGAHYSCLTDGPDGKRLQVVGISPGWKDVYPYYLPDQFVEVSDVPDGRYVLEIEIDPNDVFVELNERNNSVCTLVELTGTTAEIVEPEVPC